MKDQTLFVITQDLLALEDLLTEVGGDVTDEQAEAAIAKWFVEIGEDRANKIDSYCALIRKNDSLEKAARDEGNRILALAGVRANLVKRLKTRLKEHLETTGQTKFETAISKVWIQNNGGALPVVIEPEYLEHPEELPEGFRAVRFEPDLKAINAALTELATKRLALEGLKGRNQLEEAENLATEIADLEAEIDFAKFGERGTHLRLK